MSENGNNAKRNWSVVVGCAILAIIFIFCTVAATLSIIYRNNIPVVKNYFQTATLVPTPTLTPIPHILVHKPDPKIHVLIDDFTTNKNNWSTRYSPGKVEIKNGILSGESFNSDVVIAHCFCETEYETFADKYYLQADLSTSRQTSNSYGLVFGLTENGEFYQFTIKSQSKDYFLEQWNGDDWITFTTGLSDAIRNYPDPNTLSVYFNQGKIELFINGQSIATYQDKKPMKGKIGFVAYGMNFKLLVDNLFAYHDK